MDIVAAVEYPALPTGAHATRAKFPGVLLAHASFWLSAALIEV